MKEAIVNATKISVRAKRTRDSEQLGTLSRGDVVIVLDAALDQDYAMVIWKVGYAYSMTGKYIRMISEAEPPAANAVVTANLISVREGRGFINDRLGYYHKDDQITVLDPALDQTYAKVIWQIGYAYSAQGQYLRFKNAEPENPPVTPNEPETPVQPETPTAPGTPNAPETPAEPNAIVTAGTISVREARTVSSAKLGVLNNGAKITVLDDTLDQDYAKIVWNNGTGYAYSLKGRYIRFLAEPAAPEPNAIVTARAISVREARTVNSTKLGELKNGAKITVLDNALNQDYAKIYWNNGAGYAYSLKGRYIQFLADSEPQTPQLNAIVTAGTISVREARTASSAKLGVLNNGAKIAVLDNALDQDYAKIVWNGGIGYAYSLKGRYIRFATDTGTISERIKSVLDIAKACVGGKYMLGGQGNRITEKYVRARQAAKPSYYTNGRFEFLLDIGKKCDAANAWRFPDDFAWDCSGLWWYSANKAGIYGKSLDSTAHTFYHNYCTPIKKSELRAGDAVFYEDSAGRITHMAIVGDAGMVYEAMSGYTGVVTGSSVDDRTAPKIVGAGSLKRSPWNRFGRPKIFLE